MEGNEKEIQRLQEQLASLRSEKEALEAVLFDTQTNLEAANNKGFHLEKDNQDLMIKQESLRGQVARLTKDMESLEKRARETKDTLVRQMTSQESEYQQIISNLKKFNDENMRKLTDERVSHLVFCTRVQSSSDAIRKWRGGEGCHSRKLAYILKS